MKKQKFLNRKINAYTCNTTIGKLLDVLAVVADTHETEITGIFNGILEGCIHMGVLEYDNKGKILRSLK